MSTAIKICGVTSREDLSLLASYHVDYAGILVEITQSPRSHSRTSAQKLMGDAPLPIVNLTLNKCDKENIAIANELQSTALQLQGDESPELVANVKKHVSCEVWKAMHIVVGEGQHAFSLDDFYAKTSAYIDAGVDRMTLDASCVIGGKKQYGGTGKTIDWDIAGSICQKIPVPILLAGGIVPENVAEAIRKVHPYGIDLSSGVEVEKGKKDEDKVKKLVKEARGVNG